MTWEGTCNVCGKTRQAGHALFCSNFWLGREGFHLCRNVWCGKCYRESESDPFPRLDDNEEANSSYLDLDNTETNQQHRCGRNGDHVTRATNPSGEFNCYYSPIFTLPRKSYRILIIVKYYLEMFL